MGGIYTNTFHDAVTHLVAKVRHSATFHVIKSVSYLELQLIFFPAGRAISKVRGCGEEGHSGDDRGVGELSLGEGQGRERSRNRLTILKTQVPSTHGNHLHCLAGALSTSYLSI